MGIRLYLYYFLLLAAENLFLGGILKKLPPLVTRLYSLFFILIGWVFFASDGLAQSFSYLGRMFSLTPLRGADLYHLVRNIPFILLLVLGSTPIPKQAYDILTENGSRRLLFSLGGVFIFVFCIANLVGSSYNPFLYFRF